MYAWKDQYNNIDEIGEPTESLSFGTGSPRLFFNVSFEEEENKHEGTTIQIFQVINFCLL